MLYYCLLGYLAATTHMSNTLKDNVAIYLHQWITKLLCYGSQRQIQKFHLSGISVGP